MSDKLKKAYDLCQENKFAEAYPLAMDLAQQGDSDGEMLLGYLTYYGNGVPANEDEGLVWLKKAAAKLNLRAVQILFDIFRDQGEDDETLKILFPLAQSGDSWAQFQYGYFLFHAKNNYVEGVKYFEKLAINGSIPAMVSLSQWLSKDAGYDEVTDEVMSLQWKKKAYQELEKTQLPTYVAGLIAAYLFGAKDIGILPDKVKAFLIAKKTNQNEAEIQDEESRFGFFEAKLYLARMYQNGWGTEKNTELAETLFQEIIEGGYFNSEVDFYRTHLEAMDQEFRAFQRSLAQFNNDDSD